ncbi:MAG TPA: hypothetical protein VNJ08_02255 [Bacteriovoracaceae bacterium]|nr:hypothetical protein [Bacteriovoracaceae bacterium]
MDELVKCPLESTKIEFISPVTQAKKEICGYQKDGATIKHGYESSFDKSGKIIKQTYYVHGVEGEFKPEIDKPSQGSHTAPGNPDDHSKVISSLKEMLSVFVLKGKSSGNGSFRVDKCDTNIMSWVQAAITRSPISKTYSFKEGCDVSGSFTAKFDEEFPVNLDLRNLGEYQQTEMKVKMDFVRASAIRYSFNVVKGKIISLQTTASAEFTADYAMDVHPLPLKIDYKSQKGKINISRIKDKDVKITHPLEYVGR